jgi:hypothetical protein
MAGHAGELVEHHSIQPIHVLAGGGDVGVAIDTLFRFKCVRVVTICTVGGWGLFPEETTIVEMSTASQRDLVLNRRAEGIAGCSHMTLLAQFGRCTNRHILTRDRIQPGVLARDPILVNMVAGLARNPYPFFLRHKGVAFSDT